MAAEGAQVAVFDLHGDNADAVAKEIDGFAYAVDVTDYDALSTAMRDAADRMGGLSLLYNNAGGSTLSPLHDYEVAEWRRIVELNLTGVFHGFKAGGAAHPRERRRARSSPPRRSRGPGRPPVRRRTRPPRPRSSRSTASAALEYAPTIRVNAVSPGMIRTPLTELLLDERGIGLEERQRAKTPLDRIGTPGDIADVVVFLCSDLARFVTGQNLVVDGGMTLHGSGVDGVLDIVRDLLSQR